MALATIPQTQFLSLSYEIPRSQHFYKHHGNLERFQASCRSLRGMGNTYCPYVLPCDTARQYLDSRMVNKIPRRHCLPLQLWFSTPLHFLRCVEIYVSKESLCNYHSLLVSILIIPKEPDCICRREAIPGKLSAPADKYRFLLVKPT